MSEYEIESICKNAYEKSCHGDWSAIDDIMELHSLNTFYIYQVALEAITRNLLSYGKITEADVYDWFSENYKSILGCDYEITKRKNHVDHIPDFWLKCDGEYVPVECKLNDFNKRALQQLERYMSVYEAKIGIAVGRELKCELPKNIIFVKHYVISG